MNAYLSHWFKCMYGLEYFILFAYTEWSHSRQHHKEPSTTTTFSHDKSVLFRHWNQDIRPSSSCKYFQRRYRTSQLYLPRAYSWVGATCAQSSRAGESRVHDPVNERDQIGFLTHGSCQSVKVIVNQVYLPRHWEAGVLHGAPSFEAYGVRASRQVFPYDARVFWKGIPQHSIYEEGRKING